MEATPDAMVVYDTIEGNVTYLNPAFTRVFGWTLEEVLGKKLDFVPCREMFPKQWTQFSVCFKGKRSSLWILSRLTKDGRILDVLGKCHHLQRIGRRRWPAAW